MFLLQSNQNAEFCSFIAKSKNLLATPGNPLIPNDFSYQYSQFNLSINLHKSIQCNLTCLSGAGWNCNMFTRISKDEKISLLCFFLFLVLNMQFYFGDFYRRKNVSLPTHQVLEVIV